MSVVTVSDKPNVLNENHLSFDERAKEIEYQKKTEEDKRKRDKHSPYSNWYQFNKEHTKDMIWLATNHPKAQAVLLFLLEQMDTYNAVLCSYQVFQEALSISKQTVTRAVKVLKDKGFIVIMKSGTSNVYIINNDLAWGSWGSNQKHCKFPANVVLSVEEQSESYKKHLEFTRHKEITIKEKEQCLEKSKQENEKPINDLHVKLEM